MVEQVKKPNLFIIGASKCATTSLWDILRQHPNIYMSKDKEPSFFVHDDFKKHILHYLSLFEEADNEKYIGEASPVYSETTIFPTIARRIYEFNQDAKIIYIVRNPIDRMLSVWRQTLSSGHWYKDMYKINFGNSNVGLMPLDFEVALFKYPPFVEASKYWTHISSYLTFFSKENIHLIFFEDFIKNPEKVTSSIYDFLGINIIKTGVQFNKARNKGAKKKRLPKWFIKLSKNQQKKIRYILPPLVFDLLIKKNINTKNLFSTELQEEVIGVLEEEINSILQFGNKDQGYWTLC